MSLYLANDNCIHILGRYEEKDGALYFDNVASGVELDFIGSSISLICKSIPRPRINKNYPMFTILSAMIDNHNPVELMVEIHNEDFLEVKIADNLSYSKHHLILMKTDDPLISTFVLKGVIAEKIIPFKSNKKKLLIYGDSITAGGDNTIIAGPSLDVVPGTGIGTYTYASLFALDLDLDFQVFAQCGMPLANFTECSDAINMREIYKDISPQNHHKWDMSKFIPDLIMINLGTNDELGKNYNSQEFITEYVGFVHDVNNIYKNKTYLLICGQMNKAEDLVSSIYKVCDILNKQGIKTFVYRSKKARRGHPNVFEHRELANELISFVKEKVII